MRISTLYAFAFLLALSSGSARADLLIGIPWSSPEQLEQIAALAQVRHVTGERTLVSGDRAILAELRARGISPFLVDEYTEADRYFLVSYRTCAGHLHADPLYLDPAGWALLKLRPGDEEYGQPHFLYPLPEKHSIRGWTDRRPRAKPTALLDLATMAQILDQVDAERLEHDLKTLALKDPDAPSTLDNLRTRFTARSETFEATAYLRDHLAEVLGPEAVEVREFAVDPDRLNSHLRGQLGQGPIDYRAYNVVGTLPGTDPDAGYYVICAHYDATGVRTSGWDWRTDPAPGANDNGTGAALILEAARVLAGQTFPWSIRFIAFSGEELGLLGSRDYAEAAVRGGDEILGVLNFDMFGYNHIVDRVELATNPASRWLTDLMEEVNERYGIGLRIDVLEDAGAVLSDHAPFWARGYDAVLAIENYLPTDPGHWAVLEGLYRVNTQYHSVADVPDSINWNLLRKNAQLAVATLAHYAQAEGMPNLAVFTGDVQPGAPGQLRVQVTNIGVGLLEEPFDVRVSLCADDSTACSSIHQEEIAAGLTPGEGTSFSIPWPRLGRAVMLVEVDPADRIPEESETDNRAFQQLYVQPQERIAVYPNPYLAGPDKLLTFAGLPLKSRVRIFSTSGQLLWSALEDDSGQRKLGARAGEILWKGVNESDLLVNSGIYIYTITDAEGTLLRRDRMAVVQP